MSSQATLSPVYVPIILLGSLVRHVMLIPQQERRHYMAYVREVNQPLIEAMIKASLEEEPPRRSKPEIIAHPVPEFVLDYKTLTSDRGFGELHSILDYFPRGAAKKLQGDERLRVRHEYVSTKAPEHSHESNNEDDRFLERLLFAPCAALEKHERALNDPAFLDRQIVVLYDHDPRFRALLGSIQKEKKTKGRFGTLTENCKGGIVLAINDHDINRDHLAPRHANDSALAWFRDVVNLCFHEVSQDKSVVIVAADALRKCGERIMERGALESSANDVLKVIQSKGFDLDNFRRKCRHLVIVFRETSALHIDFKTNEGTVTFAPNFDRYAQTHDASYGRVPGKFASMVTSIVRELCWSAVNEKFDVSGALRMAVAAYNYHYDAGFAQGGPDASPFESYVNILSGKRRGKLCEGFQEGKDEYLLASVPFKVNPPVERKWGRMDAIENNLVETLIEIVQYGIEKPFRKDKKDAKAKWDINFKPPASILVPYSEYGKLTLIDPDEIERFSSLAKLIDKYIWTPTWTTPLSIAVFGAPGSGKSFAVKQIIQRVSPDRKTEPLIFNLAQFSSPDQLTEAFHKVQDSALAAHEVPLVVFDEFDSNIGNDPLGWLKYFLAPMQDGVFRGKDADYRVGRAIFLFAGGTSISFAKFKNLLSNKGASLDVKSASDGKEVDEPSERAKQAKLPDFISRLRGHLDVEGINPPEGTSLKNTSECRMILLRRAILLRSALDQHAKEIFQKIDPKRKFANINEDLILAFLYAKNYVHGSRSMEAIVQMSRFIDGYYVPTSLPTKELLEAHVDVDSFMSKIRKRHPGSDTGI